MYVCVCVRACVFVCVFVCGVMVSVIENEHADISSNPEQNFLYSTLR